MRTGAQEILKHARGIDRAKHNSRSTSFQFARRIRFSSDYFQTKRMGKLSTVAGVYTSPCVTQ